MVRKSIAIPAGSVSLEGDLVVPSKAKGLVIFVHGSGSSRRSPRNQYVAYVLNEAGIATLLFDLLTEAEDEIYETRFNIDLLTDRLSAVTAWVRANPETKTLPLGYFGASTGAAAAFQAAAKLKSQIGAVVSRGGRPDLAGERALAKVTAPTLLIVGGNDDVVIGMNQRALSRLRTKKVLTIVPGATHLFEEPGALESVARLAAGWFAQCLDEPSVPVARRR